MTCFKPALKLLLLCLATLAIAVGVFLCTPTKGGTPLTTPKLDVSDSGYLIDNSQDLQLPELPTGCEATAISTLLRVNGVDVKKTDIADAMPKSSIDFVNCFFGDPYSVNGGCCMSPCAASTAQLFLPDGLVAYQVEGLDLMDLPTPCTVWVTIDLTDPQGPIKSQGAYDMYYPSHCLTVLGIADQVVQTIDPLRGYVEYPLERFVSIYKTLGKQAVYIGKE